MKRFLITILLFVQFISANSLALVDNNDGTWDVNYSSDKEIREFSFSVDGAKINKLSHAATGSADIWLNINGSVVTGLSALGKSIPIGQGLLLVLHLSSVPTGLSNIEITDSKRKTHTYKDSSQHLLHIQKEDLEAQVVELSNITSKLKSENDFIPLEEAINEMKDIQQAILEKIATLETSMNNLAKNKPTDNYKQQPPQADFNEAELKENNITKSNLNEEKNYNFRKTMWGDSKNKVKSSENRGKIMRGVSPTTLGYSNLTVGGLETILGYYFVNDKLWKGVYIFQVKHSNRNLYLEDYSTIKYILTDKYGDPKKDNIKWSNDLYADDSSQYGFAVSLGHLSLNCTWIIDDTIIFMELVGDNYKISHKLSFYSGTLEKSAAQIINNLRGDDF